MHDISNDNYMAVLTLAPDHFFATLRKRASILATSSSVQYYHHRRWHCEVQCKVKQGQCSCFAAELPVSTQQGAEVKEDIRPRQEAQFRTSGNRAHKKHPWVTGGIVYITSNTYARCNRQLLEKTFVPTTCMWD